MDEADAKGTGVDVSEPEGADDRRTEVRHLACFPAAIETGAGSPRTALIRDLSLSGALLLTQVPLPVGQEVRLALYLDEEHPRVVSGTVVRDERRDLLVAHPWTHSVGVRFDEPLTDLETDVMDLAARQEKLLGRAAH